MPNTLAQTLLADCGWLPVYLASSAVIAFADHDSRTAARAIAQVHALPESRAKATTIVLMRGALDSLIAADPTLDVTVITTQRLVDRSQAAEPGRLADFLRRCARLLGLLPDPRDRIDAAGP